ncbi:MAG: hypothetical protein GQ564_22320 [Bacteroidales bacterium]|nr:hypothetical protein [Bacteroidales bacterium]
MKSKLLLLFICIAISGAVFGQQKESSKSKTKISSENQYSYVYFKKGADTYKLPYFRNIPLKNGNEHIKRAVIIIRGYTKKSAKGKTKEAYDIAMKAYRKTKAEATSMEKTIILAPTFPIQQKSNLLYWDKAGWICGDEAKNNYSLSSFSAIDTIIHRLVTRFSNLEQIVIAGHSGGGQFTHRYSACTPIVDFIKNKYDINIRFVIANPSTYLYMDNYRRVKGTTYEFKEEASKYNNYKYGLDNLITYPKTVGIATIRKQMQYRECVYFLGNKDVKPTIDKSDAALIQGANRYERGLIYKNYLDNHFYKEHNQTFHIIDGVGHDYYHMFMKLAIRNKLFR